MTDKQRNILIVAGVLLVTIPLLIWGITSFVSRVSSDDVIRDQDTNEVYEKGVNNQNTGGSSSSFGSVTLFGIQPYIETLMAEDKPTGYITSVKQALLAFSKNRLDNKYETITLRPEGLVSNGTEITGEIRLGQTDTILPITIKPSNDQKLAVVTINKGGTDFKGAFVLVGNLNDFENLLFNISQKDDHVSDLEIKAYDGYREAALRYIEDLGYNVPDFKINFSNYENPFK